MDARPCDVMLRAKCTGAVDEVSQRSLVEFRADGFKELDFIYSEDVFEHIPPAALENLIARLSRRLSPQGVALITPNIFTGGYNFHSKLEFNSRRGLEKTTETLVELVSLIAEASS